MAGSTQILIVEDQLLDHALWSAASVSLEGRATIAIVASAPALQAAVLNDRWDAVVSKQELARLSTSAVLAMIGVIDPPPPVILHAGLPATGARRGATATDLLTAALRIARVEHRAEHRVEAAAHAGTSVRNAHWFADSEIEATRALRESEERFRTLTEIAPVGIYLTDSRQHCVYVNERWCEITGLSAAEAIGRDWRACLRMEDDALQSTAIFASEPATPLPFECRIARADKSVAWVIGQILPHRDPQGEIIGHCGVITDITDRKYAELASLESEQRLHALSAHLVGAEERQRASIAREIHDDIGSSLTGMKIDVMWLKGMTRASDEAQQKLAGFERLIDSAAAASVRIAKALRPSILDDGIAPAIEWQLREFSKRYGIWTDFTGPKQEPVLSAEQSIALFRILQEALNNVAKHAEARNVDVVLFCRTGEITLEIHDDGRGLPASEGQSGPASGAASGATSGATRDGSFGIIGMRERVFSLGGWLTVDGPAGKGVTVMAGIPLDDKTHRRGARASQ